MPLLTSTGIFFEIFYSFPTVLDAKAFLGSFDKLAAFQFVVKWLNLFNGNTSDCIKQEICCQS